MGRRGAKRAQSIMPFASQTSMLQWVQDTWHDSYEGAPGDGAAWEDGAAFRVFRGGGWGDDATWLRAADRNGAHPTLRNNGLGFRPARSVP